MPDRRDDLDITRRPRDQRMQYGQMEHETDAETGERTGPAPYDQAEPGTPEHHVITKGERERPGPSGTSGKTGNDVEHTTMKQHERERKPVDASQGDDLLQTSQVDRQGSAATRRGRPVAQDKRRINQDPDPDDLEESP